MSENSPQTQQPRLIVSGMSTVMPAISNGIEKSKYQPISGSDFIFRHGDRCDIITNIQCISAMAEYEHISLEELRFREYNFSGYGPFVKMTSRTCENEHVLQRCYEMLMKRPPDVQFVIEYENEVVKLPAHKDVLAASSSVFNAMFNGDLCEKGDVNIVDASPNVFKEFLRFFYVQKVILTMDNIREMLYLVDKYDVADVIPILVDFLEVNLAIDNIVWILFLAIEFRLVDLEASCKKLIRGNSRRVSDSLRIDDEGRFCATFDYLLSGDELKHILPHVITAMDFP